MSTIGFWTATVAEKSFLIPPNVPLLDDNKTQTRVDDYFFIAGKKAYVLLQSFAEKYTDIKSDKGINKEACTQIRYVVLLPFSSPLWLTILKIVSYCTIIIPLIMLGLKIYCRNQSTRNFFDEKTAIEYRAIPPDQIKIPKKQHNHL